MDTKLLLALLWLTSYSQKKMQAEYGQCLTFVLIPRKIQNKVWRKGLSEDRDTLSWILARHMCESFVDLIGVLYDIGNYIGTPEYLDGPLRKYMVLVGP